MVANSNDGQKNRGIFRNEVGNLDKIVASLTEFMGKKLSIDLL